MKAAIAIAASLLAGCATCQQHPLACATAIALTGAIAAQELRGPVEAQHKHQPPMCIGDHFTCK